MLSEFPANQIRPATSLIASTLNRAHEGFPDIVLTGISGTTAPGSACAKAQIQRNVCNLPLTFDSRPNRRNWLWRKS